MTNNSDGLMLVSVNSERTTTQTSPKAAALAAAGYVGTTHALLAVREAKRAGKAGAR